MQFYILKILVYDVSHQNKKAKYALTWEFGPPPPSLQVNYRISSNIRPL